MFVERTRNWLRNYGYASVKSAQNFINSAQKTLEIFSEEGHSRLPRPRPYWEGANEFLLERGTEFAKKLRICICQKCTEMH